MKNSGSVHMVPSSPSRSSHSSLPHRRSARRILYGLLGFCVCLGLLIAYHLTRSSDSPNPFKRKRMFERVCPQDGEGSAAPLNYAILLDNISDAVGRINRKLRSRLKTDETIAILSTAVNEEAAKHNLPIFLESLKFVEPSLIYQTIIFCLDDPACKQCQRLHNDPTLCLYMNLGVSGESLAPVPHGKDFNSRSYWRLTYGRVYTTLMIHNEGVNVLPVDVDSVFLRNPFSVGEEIPQEPHRISGVVDSEPFDLASSAGAYLLNGGFLYFPATTPKVAIATNQLIRNIWRQSCYKQNEQIVTSDVIKAYYRSKNKGDPLRPRILSLEKYRNFCNTNCGTQHNEFKSITSIADLHAIEKRLQHDEKFSVCSAERRKDWVFFHSACADWPQGKSTELAKAKGLAQAAMLQWYQEAVGKGTK